MKKLTITCSNVKLFSMGDNRIWNFNNLIMYQIKKTVIPYDHKQFQPTQSNLTYHIGNTLHVFVFAVSNIHLYDFLLSPRACKMRYHW